MPVDAVVETYTSKNPFPARIAENRLLSRPGSGKETRHVVVDIAGSGITFKPGDSLGVYPTNRPGEVEELLGRLGASGDEPVSPALLRLPAPIPLREALFSRLSLAGPTARVLGALAQKTPDAGERAALEALLKPEAKDALVDYLSVREYVDLLAEFPRARLTPQELVDLMRKLMPRMYSIASSQRVHPDEVHLTVAVVRYETNHRGRVGACTTFLADRVSVGETTVPVFVSHAARFGLPEDPAADCIMVGPGAGVAPFRAFVQERAAAGATGRNWLFFGDQKRATDFLYEEDWTAFQADHRLQRLSLAWSRDQAGKVYVQHRLREEAAELWAWIKGGAYFYVCGDAQHMAKDVDAALLEIVAQEGNMDAAAAAEYVKQMRKDKRYQRDVY